MWGFPVNFTLNQSIEFVWENTIKRFHRYFRVFSWRLFNSLIWFMINMINPSNLKPKTTLFDLVNDIFIKKNPRLLKHHFQQKRETSGKYMPTPWILWHFGLPCGLPYPTIIHHIPHFFLLTSSDLSGSVHEASQFACQFRTTNHSDSKTHIIIINQQQPTIIYQSSSYFGIMVELNHVKSPK